MNSDKIVYMVNQIASFFKHKQCEESIIEIASHINNFWEPRMRNHLLKIIRNKYPGIDDRVLKARDLIRSINSC